jgi:hypothetical protein
MNGIEIKDLPFALRSIVISAPVMGKFKQEILLYAADAIEVLLAVCKQQEIDLVNLTGQLAEVSADRDHLREAAKMMPKWISVEERLPEQGKRYLVLGYFHATNKPFIEILWHDAHDLWWNRLYKGDYSVTHWMPLPEPPKEENTHD